MRKNALPSLSIPKLVSTQPSSRSISSLSCHTSRLRAAGAVSLADHADIAASWCREHLAGGPVSVDHACVCLATRCAATYTGAVFRLGTTKLARVIRVISLSKALTGTNHPFNRTIELFMVPGSGCIWSRLSSDDQETTVCQLVNRVAGTCGDCVATKLDSTQ